MASAGLILGWIQVPLQKSNYSGLERIYFIKLKFYLEKLISKNLCSIIGRLSKEIFQITRLYLQIKEIFMFYHLIIFIFSMCYLPARVLKIKTNIEILPK